MSMQVLILQSMKCLVRAVECPVSAVMGSENVQMLYLSAYECKTYVLASQRFCCAVIGPYQVENYLNLQKKSHALPLPVLLGSYHPY